MINNKGELLLGLTDRGSHGILSSAINGVLMAIFSCFKLSLYFWSYPLVWALDLFHQISKILRVLLSFIVGGLQAVFRSLGVGVFGEKIHYAILKENGQYLKLPGKTLEDVFTCQLYDYSIRKFLSVPTLQDDLKVTQLQFWSTTGLSYIRKNLGLQNVTGVHNSMEKLNKFHLKNEGLTFNFTNYSTEKQTSMQDIFIYFSRNVQNYQSYDNYTDIIKILTYIKRNLNENGYAIFGNCFTVEGEIKVFQQLLDAFGFKVEREEDIIKNILHSRKVLWKTHKNRKLTWLIGRGKEAIGQYLSQCSVLTRLWEFMQKTAGLKQQFSKYKIYILEHKVIR